MQQPTTTARNPKMTLAPWDNSGLRERLETDAAEAPRRAVELELRDMARKRDPKRPARRLLRGRRS
jgi:hypothetical protein